MSELNHKNHFFYRSTWLSFLLELICNSHSLHKLFAFFSYSFCLCVLWGLCRLFFLLYPALRFTICLSGKWDSATIDLSFTWKQLKVQQSKRVSLLSSFSYTFIRFSFLVDFGQFLCYSSADLESVAWIQM